MAALWLPLVLAVFLAVGVLWGYREAAVQRVLDAGIRRDTRDALVMGEAEAALDDDEVTA